MKRLYVHTFVILLLSTTHLHTSNGMEPATIHVDRNWEIPDSTRVGEIVKTVRVTGNVDVNNINFALELDDPFSPNVDNPFWINSQTGFVYLNKSLEGMVCRTLFSCNMQKPENFHSGSILKKKEV